MRVDYFFSYWIFGWYILYVCQIVKYNPKFALTIGLLENIIKVGTMLYYKNTWLLIVLFSVANFLLKIIPLWTLRHAPYTKRQVISTLVLFMVYVVYLFGHGKTVWSILVKSYDDVKHNRFLGPLSYLLKKLM